MRTEISKEEFLDVMSEAIYACVDINGGEHEMIGIVRMDFGKGSHDYPDGQPAFIDVEHCDHVYLGEYLDDGDTQYFYEKEYGRPVFTINASDIYIEPLKIMFLQPIEFD